MKQLDDLLEIIAFYLNIPVDKILLARCKREQVYARDIYCYLALEFRYAIQSELARKLKVDRATVHYGKRNIEDWLPYNKELQRDLNAIRNFVYQKDKSLVLKNILQLAPPEVLPRLVDKIDEWIKEIEVITEDVLESTPKNIGAPEPLKTMA